MELQDTPYWIRGDKYHIDNAINSLLENARKYSKDEIHVKLTAKKEKKGVVIGISDTGIGISKEMQKKVFEKYYRVPKGDTHDVKGYGLGLHYVKRIVTLHGGRIAVDSKVGAGTTFTMTLPLTE